MAGWQNYIEQYRADQRIPIIIAIVCIASLCIAIWKFAHDFSNHFVTTTNASIKPIQTLPEIANLHLFGIYRIQNIADLPSTQLQLSLVGTVIMINAPKQSRALIASPGGQTKVYAVGAIVPGNATVARVEQRYVVLNNNGELQKLSLPIEKLMVE